MEFTVLILLGSGLFLGWSLGANDAANVFGTAVGTRMVSFFTAALVCSVFVVLGAVLSGAGAAQTLGKLGSINALAGAFMAALAAAVSVYMMTRWGLPVSTSQAIVGAIIGWNLFSGSVTDIDALVKILLTWVACPVLAGLIAVPLFKLVELALRRARLHLLRLDAYTRFALIAAGAFGAYSLGANNIANVMGVFVPVSPFSGIRLPGGFALNAIQELFLLGALAIAVGVFTYSKRVMLTVGNDLMPMSPVRAWVVVVAHSIVLFLFASEGLEQLLAGAGLPTIPLVPVSSSQAVIGAAIGIGLMHGGRGIRWSVLAQIGTGWVATPFLSAGICFVGLFFLQNTFDQQVYSPISFRLSPPVLAKLAGHGIDGAAYAELTGRAFPSGRRLLEAMREQAPLSPEQARTVVRFAESQPLRITAEGISRLDWRLLSAAQVEALRELQGHQFAHKWQLAEALAERALLWRRLPDSVIHKPVNQRLDAALAHVFRVFAVNG